ncbi:MAG TPA: hypothetical protein VFW60_04430 [Rhodanobacteraceae bacterium]|nr:hypothetical protein [Rhodanobacteraceae bacterium]
MKFCDEITLPLCCAFAVHCIDHPLIAVEVPAPPIMVVITAGFASVADAVATADSSNTSAVDIGKNRKRRFILDNALMQPKSMA